MELLNTPASSQKHVLASPLKTHSTSRLILKQLESKRVARQKANQLQKRLQEAYERMQQAKAEK